MLGAGGRSERRFHLRLDHRDLLFRPEVYLEQPLKTNYNNVACTPGLYTAVIGGLYVGLYGAMHGGYGGAIAI